VCVYICILLYVNKVLVESNAVFLLLINILFCFIKHDSILKLIFTVIILMYKNVIFTLFAISFEAALMSFAFLRESYFLLVPAFKIKNKKNRNYLSNNIITLKTYTSVENCSFTFYLNGIPIYVLVVLL
jgi:hypothetical protein